MSTQTLASFIFLRVDLCTAFESKATLAWPVCMWIMISSSLVFNLTCITSERKPFRWALAYLTLSGGICQWISRAQGRHLHPWVLVEIPSLLFRIILCEFGVVLDDKRERDRKADGSKFDWAGFGSLFAWLGCSTLGKWLMMTAGLNALPDPTIPPATRGQHLLRACAHKHAILVFFPPNYIYFFPAKSLFCGTSVYCLQIILLENISSAHRA